VFRDPAALTFLSRRKRRGYPLLVVALLAEQGFVTAALLQPVHNPAEATALAAVIVGGGSAAIVWIYRRYNVATNIRAYSPIPQEKFRPSPAGLPTTSAPPN